SAKHRLARLGQLIPLRAGRAEQSGRRDAAEYPPQDRGVGAAPRRQLVDGQRAGGQLLEGADAEQPPDGGETRGGERGLEQDPGAGGGRGLALVCRGHSTTITAGARWPVSRVWRVFTARRPRLA